MAGRHISPALHVTAAALLYSTHKHAENKRTRGGEDVTMHANANATRSAGAVMSECRVGDWPLGIRILRTSYGYCRALLLVVSIYYYYY